MTVVPLRKPPNKILPSLTQSKAYRRVAKARWPSSENPAVPFVGRDEFPLTDHAWVSTRGWCREQSAPVRNF